MSENEKTGGETQGFTPPATQEELNKIIADRLDRERKKFADYADLKAKAAQFDDLENAKKSAEDRANERLTKLEQELESARNEATRSRVQARYGISDDDAALFLTATDADQLEAQAKTLADRISDRKTRSPRVPEQTGDPAGGGTDPMREFARQIFSE